MTGDNLISSAALDGEDRVYAGSVDGNLYSLASAGTLAWSYRADGPVNSSPAIGTDGRDDGLPVENSNKFVIQQ